MIEYLQWRDGLSFGDACAALAGDAIPTATRAAAPRAPRPERGLRTATPQWQATAAALVTWAEAKIWADAVALSYLRGRGLTDDTIRDAHLGYIPTPRDGDPAKWGLAVWIPAGYVIPCYASGVLLYVKVRDWMADPSIRRLVAYHRARCMVRPAARGHADLVLCEGELNALILRQCLAPVCAGPIGGRGWQPVPRGGPGGDRLRAATVGAVRPGQGGEGATSCWPLDRARALTWP